MTTFSANRCLIATGEGACRDCGAIGRVVCLVLPHDLEAIDDEQAAGGPVWDGAAVLHYVTRMDPALLAAIDAPFLRLAPTRTSGLTYYANRCEHCDSLTGDYYLHHPDGPFWTQWGDRTVGLRLFDQPVTIDAESCGTVTFELGEHQEDFEGAENLRREAATRARAEKRRIAKAKKPA